MVLYGQKLTLEEINRDIDLVEKLIRKEKALDITVNEWVAGKGISRFHGKLVGVTETGVLVEAVDEVTEIPYADGSKGIYSITKQNSGEILMINWDVQFLYGKDFVLPYMPKETDDIANKARWLK